jgi:predicted DNA-binding transcriptional regulator AlpA
MRRERERPRIGGSEAAGNGADAPPHPTASTRLGPSAIEHPADYRPEAPADPPTIGETLSKLADILPRLADVVERAETRPRADRMALRLDEVADALGVSRRVIERERTEGRLPAPDLVIGRMPLWKVQTIKSWLERGGRP